MTYFFWTNPRGSLAPNQPAPSCSPPSWIRRYGEEMQDWHSSQGDPIYAVGSFAFAGRIHPDRETWRGALRNLERDLAEPHSSWTKKDLAELRRLRRQTDQIIGECFGPRSASSKPDTQILRGMARGPWSDFWATEQEERGRSFLGQDIYEVAPERVPKGAVRWAHEVATEISRLNESKSLGELYDLAVSRGYGRDRESFGSDLVLQVAGHGVSYCDRMPAGNCKLIKLPHRSFYI